MRNCGCHSHNGLLLSPEGLAQRDSFVSLSPLGVDEKDDQLYVDTDDSVSGLELERDLYEIQTSNQLLEQCERFLDGS